MKNFLKMREIILLDMLAKKLIYLLKNLLLYLNNNE